MFLPLGLLLAASVAPLPRPRIELAALIVASVLGCLWATGVNFAQLWFPTRTVSLNNLVAEFLGVIGGAVLWNALGGTALRWWRQLLSGGGISLKAALSGYVVLYLIASLTPFDFVTSAGELAEKAASELYGLWIAPVSCGPAPCGLKFLSTMFAAIPCGWWFAARRRQPGNAWLAAIPAALLVATIIEVLHFLMVSGVSQGASVFVRASGMVLGAATYSWRHRVGALDLNRVGPPAALALFVVNVAAIAYVAGWFRSQILSVAAAVARLDEMVWMPFFYQYYAPYQSTMYSAMVHAVLYAPIGVVCWLSARRRDRVGLWVATAFAGVLALVAETSKVFLHGRLPDFTDVLIAAVAATATLAVLRLASRSQHTGRDSHLDRSVDAVLRSRCQRGPRKCSSKLAGRRRGCSPDRRVPARHCALDGHPFSGLAMGTRARTGALWRDVAALPGGLSDRGPVAAPGARSRSAQRPILLGRVRRRSCRDARRATAAATADPAEGISTAEGGALALVSVGLGKHSDWPMAAGAGGRECVFKLFEQLQRAARRQRLCLGGCGTLAHCARCLGGSKRCSAASDRTCVGLARSNDQRVLGATVVCRVAGLGKRVSSRRTGFGDPCRRRLYGSHTGGACPLRSRAGRHRRSSSAQTHVVRCGAVGHGRRPHDALAGSVCGMARRGCGVHLGVVAEVQECSRVFSRVALAMGNRDRHSGPARPQPCRPRCRPICARGSPSPTPTCRYERPTGARPSI